MPCDHLIADDFELAYVHLSGTVTGSEVNEAYRAYLEDPAWRPSYRVLWNGRGITALLVDWDEIEAFRGIAAGLEDRVGGGRTAIVVTRHVDLTIAKNYTLFQARDERKAKGRETLIVPDLASAAAWLDLSVEAIGAVAARRDAPRDDA